MPYIVKDRRDTLERNGRSGYIATNAGELNFMFSRIISEYFGEARHYSYTKVNEVVGALECAKLEVYRRIAAPYEDTKIKENGDVY
jgi:hypothetical protein